MDDVCKSASLTGEDNFKHFAGVKPMKTRLAVMLSCDVMHFGSSKPEWYQGILSWFQNLLLFFLEVLDSSAGDSGYRKKNEWIKTHLSQSRRHTSWVPPIFVFTDSHWGLIWLPHWCEMLAVTMMVRKGKRSWQGHAAKHQGPCVRTRACANALTHAAPRHSLLLSSSEKRLLRLAVSICLSWSY